MNAFKILQFDFTRIDMRLKKTPSPQNPGSRTAPHHGLPEVDVAYSATLGSVQGKVTLPTDLYGQSNGV